MKKLIRALSLFSILLFANFHAHAAHLLGGHLSYECIGPEQFRFTLTLFRAVGSEGVLVAKCLKKNP